MASTSKKKLVVSLFHKYPFWTSADRHIKAIRERFPKWEVVRVASLSEYEREIPDAFAIWGWRLPPEILAKAESLRWATTPAAGINYLWSPELENPERGITFSTTHGFHGIMMSEWVIGMLLMIGRRLDVPKVQGWSGFDSVAMAMSEGMFDLYGKTMVIVGLGSIGLHVAIRAKSFGMRITGLRRDPSKPLEDLSSDVVRSLFPHPSPMDCVDQWYSLDQTEAALSEADIVVNILPGSDSTRDFFNRSKFDMMKPGVVYVNIGRGVTTNTDDLLDAVRSGHVAAAALDVTAQSVLDTADRVFVPDDHPLLREPRVFCSPHMSAFSDRYIDYAMRVLFEQMRRVDAGESLLFVQSGPQVVQL